MLPITTEAGIFLSEYMIYLSLIAIIYISFVAYAQTDMKKLIAYSSVAHMGFVTLGIFLVFHLLGNNLNAAVIGLEGAIIQMISHGLISAALFFCIGIIYKHSKSRLLKDNYGVVTFMPLFSFLMLFFLMANSGLPGTSGFRWRISCYNICTWIKYHNWISCCHIITSICIIFTKVREKCIIW
jgi:NADH-quinone oxidoreductase subunit M